MNCAACRDWLLDYLDGATGGDASPVDGHLRDCAGCAELYATARRFRAVLSTHPKPRPRPGLSESVVSEYLREVRRRRRRNAALTAFALAAAALLAVGVRLVGPGNPRPQGPTPVASEGGSPTKPVDPRPAKQPPLRDAVAQARSVVETLTSRTTEEALGGTKRLLPSVATPPLKYLELPPGPSVRPLREAGEGVTAGLEPVTTSARRAVGLFLRDLPPVDGEARRGL